MCFLNVAPTSTDLMQIGAIAQTQLLPIISFIHAIARYQFPVVSSYPSIINREGFVSRSTRCRRDVEDKALARPERDSSSPSRNFTTRIIDVPSHKGLCLFAKISDEIGLRRWTKSGILLLNLCYVPRLGR